MEHPHFM